MARKAAKPRKKARPRKKAALPKANTPAMVQSIKMKPVKPKSSSPSSVTIGIVIILVIIAFIAISLPATTSKPAYCNEPNVVSVSSCTDGSYKAMSSLLGGGYTIHKTDGSSFQCPVIAEPSEECNYYLRICNDANLC